MQNNGLQKAHPAPRLGVSSQYVNLLDIENLTLSMCPKLKMSPAFLVSQWFKTLFIVQNHNNPILAYYETYCIN